MSSGAGQVIGYAHDGTPALSRGRAALVWAVGVVTWGLLLFSYRYLGVLAAGEWEPVLPKFIEEMTGGLTLGVLFFPVRALVRGVPLGRATWRRYWVYYIGALAAFGVAATTLLWVMRLALFPLAGLGPYHYGVMPMRYLMELPMEAIVFATMVGGIHAVEAFRAAHVRQVRAAQLEGHLAQAQLKNLRLQLQPHFLFNTLNTISSTMYRDPAAADEMIQQLSDLLRASLHTAQRDEVPLRVELEVLDLYLAIMRARFGERLAVTLTIDERATDALVPSMILQPLVENSIRHGNAAVTGAGRVEVRAALDGSALVIEVEDDGPGPPAGDEPRTGIGLTATAERLALLYGDAPRFDAGPGARGGYLVRIVIPYRAATVAAS